MNNYNGYLLKFGSQILPNSFLLEYKSTPNRRSEASAETDQNGALIRETLTHTRSTLSFSTHILKLDQKIQFQSIINSSIINALQRKATVEYWNDETNSYSSGYFYIPDIEYSVKDADNTDILYNPISVELIEY